MNVLKYLNEKGIEALQSELAIKVNVWNDLYILNYDQIDSPKNHPVTNECRSLVVAQDESGQWRTVSRSFDRFFNYGEIAEDSHDITKMTAFEKVDGSVVSLFYHNDQWLYRTRSMIMPETTVNGWDKTWKELIEPVLLERGFKEHPHDTNLTYIFEVVGTENRVVTRYNESAAYLLAIRHNTSGVYYDMSEDAVALRGWKLPKRYTFRDFSECLTAAKELPDLNEGYVLYDNFGVPSLKVKNPAYVAAHLLRGEGLNPKRILQLIIMGETKEYLAVFPEDAEHFEPYIKANVLLEGAVAFTHEYTKEIQDQKEYALKVKGYCYSGVLFSARKQNKDPIQVLHSMEENYRLKLLTQFMKENDL